MGIRAKDTRNSPRRATVAVSKQACRNHRSARDDRGERNPRIQRITTRVESGRPPRGFPPAEKISSASLDSKLNSNAHANGLNGYGKALRFRSTLSDFEKLRIVRYNTQNFDLDRMRLLLKKLGNPQDKFKSIHIAGTKGKGSTCAMIASMLDASGYKTGLYTSPHLIDIRERIAIAGEMISQSEFARLIRRIEP